MKKRHIIIVVALLSACAAGVNYAPAYTYNEIHVVNNSREPIQKFMIKEVGSDRIFSCENIAALGFCQNRFGRRRYKSGAFSVDWVFGGSERKTNEIEVHVPAYNSPGAPVRVVFEISAEGEMSVHFEQDSLIR